MKFEMFEFCTVFIFFIVVFSTIIARIAGEYSVSYYTTIYHELFHFKVYIKLQKSFDNWPPPLVIIFTTRPLLQFE